MKVQKASADVISCIVMDLTLFKRDVRVAGDGNSSALHMGARFWSVLRSFLDRGAFEESTQKVQERKHAHS